MPVTLEQVTVRATNAASTANTANTANGASAVILDALNCTFHDGEVTLVLGATGAGKSTLLRAAAGVWGLQAGTVRYDGISLWDDRRRPRMTQSVQRRIGYVFQQPEYQLFARTVEEELRYSFRPYHLDERTVQQRIHQALEEVHLPVDILPVSPLLLSGGQKRRVALASTIATDPDWLFLDEPTAGLDTEAIHALTAWLRRRLARTPKRDTVDGGAGGIVIATHDLEWLLPIADRVLILQRGQIAFDGQPEQLYAAPHRLLETGVGLPQDLELALRFRDAGLPISLAWRAPEAMAQAICDHVLQTGLAAQGSPALREPADSAERQPPGHAARPPEPRTQADRVDHASSAGAGGGRRWWFDRDPRAKWVFILLASVCVLWQRSWTAMAIAALLTLVVAASSGVRLRQFTRVLKPLFFLAAASTLVSGVRFHATSAGLWHVGPVGFAWHAASVTLAQVVKVMLVVILGTLLSGTTSTLALKRGMEQGLRGLQRIRVPVGAFALGASLLLRFIPVIGREANRFSEIVRVRGKYPVRSGALRMRDMMAMLLPLLLGVIRLGEELAIAMEARGYQPTRRIPRLQQTFDTRDAWMMTAGIAMLGVCAALRWLLPG
ncbi:ATP-binding cassette domain-containing protein [Alicyclobacillus cycloheptanicus]|uniref:Energy-coupling factor transport system ATP-binding protein n=1 Tax=Alicyclobacillus cycloheptanicus TaxID=1457 RepID=A0ABT9XKH1_9BACL|nr:ATP-binding cassette domain-containing protein [Alicyclobacillus cycloheptanicus]MDQ0190770.1 energy-coupling factor transport system ATP-binding protein [Alicyclobacillus cycloheptanicus]WDM02740.1 ATP-binding cassette domain-containing protein [Alicyclobacillus cycloheptanicus]